jgi:hypothetical protein
MAERAAFVRGLGQLQGWIGGKPISGVLPPGSDIPPGDYLFLPPVKDPIYGQIVQMVAVGAPQGSTVAIPNIKGAPPTSDRQEKNKCVQWCTEWIRGAPATSQSPFVKATFDTRFEKSDLNFEKGNLNFAKAVTYSDPPGSDSAAHVKLADPLATKRNGPSFILSSMQIPGRNSVLVGSGFSDLVESLAQGPVPVKVS